MILIVIVNKLFLKGAFFDNLPDQAQGRNTRQTKSPDFQTFALNNKMRYVQLKGHSYEYHTANRNHNG